MWIELNASDPAPPAGEQNVHFRTDAAHLGTEADPVPTSAFVPNTGAVNVQTANYALQASDCGKLVVVNSPTPVTITVPAAVPFNQWNCQVANIGAGQVSISPGAAHIDGGSGSLLLAQGQSLYLATDGTNYFSGRGNAAPAAAYDIVLYWPAVFPAAQVCLELNVVRPFALSLNLTGSIAQLDIAPSAAMVFNITRTTGGVTATIGSINFASGATAGTLTFAAAVTFAAGDKLEVVAPGAADLTAAGLSLTLMGSR